MDRLKISQTETRHLQVGDPKFSEIQWGISSEVKRVYGEALKSADAEAIYGRVVNFCELLQKEFPDHLEYLLYHTIILSTPREETTKFDFPGKWSIEAFVKRGFMPPEEVPKQ